MTTDQPPPAQTPPPPVEPAPPGLFENAIRGALLARLGRLSTEALESICVSALSTLTGDEDDVLAPDLDADEAAELIEGLRVAAILAAARDAQHPPDEVDDDDNLGDDDDELRDEF